MMRRAPLAALLLLALPLLCGLGTGCAVPTGSHARPVRPMSEGSVSFGGGAMVPVAVAGGASVGGKSAFGSSTASKLVFIPGGSFDYAFQDGHTVGANVAVWTPARLGGGAGPDLLAIFVNPRFEVPLDEPDRRLVLTIDTNLGYLRSRAADGTTVSGPFFSPTVGVRWYLPTGFGGFVLSQQLGTGFITFNAPGSLAYDLPIPLGDVTLHLFPEFRWDPTLIVIGDLTGGYSFFSAGLSFQIEG